MLPFVVAIALTASLQTQESDWTRAVRLSRDGRTDEAIALYEKILEQNPANVDARIGLGAARIRKGDWRAALEILEPLERDHAENSDLLGALARAYRRSGDDRRALEYFERARARAPDDPDLVQGFESVARVYGHAVGVEGLMQRGTEGTRLDSGSAAVVLQVVPVLRVHARGRVQRGSGYSDALAGGGALWRAGRATTIAFLAQGGPDNIALARSDLSGEVTHYAGHAEPGLSVRHLSFASSSVFALSPTFAWDQDRWRTTTRYTYSRSTFDSTGETRGDHSVMLRETWWAWRRVALNAAYAYGIESFEDLTADRLGSLGTTTAAAGAQIELPSLTRIAATWEHQWRSNDTTVDRLTVSLVQVLR